MFLIHLNIFQSSEKMVGSIEIENGDKINVFRIKTKSREASDVHIGPLICYEDIFPSLCIDIARKGVDLFFVSTNNAWFGEEGCAIQHAAHSVMRAVETQRPFLRCGNSGWSGWIDRNGFQREIIRDENGSIYLIKGTVLNLYLDLKAKNENSFYVSNCDLFPYFCLLTFLLWGEHCFLNLNNKIIILH